MNPDLKRMLREDAPVDCEIGIEQFLPLPAAPGLGGLLAAGVLDENAPHGLGRGGEEVTKTVPVPRGLDVHQPEVGFVNQGCGLERLARLVLCQLLRGQLAELVVDQRQELLGRLGISLLNVGEDTTHFTHRQARRQSPGRRPRPAPERGARCGVTRSGIRALAAEIQFIPCLLRGIAPRHPQGSDVS
jgi:hypothetical protein